MQGHALDIEAVEKCLTDVLQQDGGSRHEIGDARIERINMIIWIGTHIDQFPLARLGIGTIPYRRDTPLVGSRQLQAVGIGESLLVIGYGIDSMLDLRTANDMRFRLRLCGDDGDGRGARNSDLWPYTPHDGEENHNYKKP